MQRFLTDAREHGQQQPAGHEAPGSPHENAMWRAFLDERKASDAAVNTHDEKPAAVKDRKVAAAAAADPSPATGRSGGGTSGGGGGTSGSGGGTSGGGDAGGGIGGDDGGSGQIGRKMRE